MLNGSKDNWLSGWEASNRVYCTKTGLRNSSPLESCCHSNYRYLQQKLLPIVSWFSESGHLLLAMSKVNHILLGLSKPGPTRQVVCRLNWESTQEHYYPLSSDSLIPCSWSVQCTILKFAFLPIIYLIDNSLVSRNLLILWSLYIANQWTSLRLLGAFAMKELIIWDK